MNHESKTCFPSGAKARILGGLYGTAETVPFQNGFTFKTDL